MGAKDTSRSVAAKERRRITYGNEKRNTSNVNKCKLRYEILCHLLTVPLFVAVSFWDLHYKYIGVFSIYLVNIYYFYIFQ